MNKIFNSSANSNFFILLISYLVYPLSLLFAKFRIRPNLITSFSFIFSILAAFFLIKGQNNYFIFFWLFSSLLDFCDGQVARMTNNVNKTGFRYDSFGDLIKIKIIIISSAIVYNDFSYWILSSIIVFLFPYSFILQSTLSLYIKKKKTLGKIYLMIFFFKKLSTT